jgi:hypothetical protein
MIVTAKEAAHIRGAMAEFKYEARKDPAGFKRFVTLLRSKPPFDPERDTPRGSSRAYAQAMMQAMLEVIEQIEKEGLA